jgi:hypothetical protein
MIQLILGILRVHNILVYFAHNYFYSVTVPLFFLLQLIILVPFNTIVIGKDVAVMWRRDAVVKNAKKRQLLYENTQ